MRYVYVIRNRVNGKVYVGQTKSPTKRKAGHFYLARHGDQRPLYASIRKHGAENFTFEVLEECVNDAIDECERLWVAHFDSFNPKKGYNLTRGGERLCEISEEIRQRLVEFNSGEANPFYGKHHSEEAKKAISRAQVGNQHSVGVVLSSEQKQRQSQALKASWEKDQVRKDELSKRMFESWKRRARKLSADDVQRIIERLNNGELANVVASEYGVSPSMITRVKKGTYRCASK